MDKCYSVPGNVGLPNHGTKKIIDQFHSFFFFSFFLRNNFTADSLTNSMSLETSPINFKTYSLKLSLSLSLSLDIGRRRIRERNSRDEFVRKHQNPLIWTEPSKFHE